jgi:hypothetical protein
MPLIVLGIIVIVGSLALILNAANTSMKNRKIVIEDADSPAKKRDERGSRGDNDAGKVIRLFPDKEDEE